MEFPSTGSREAKPQVSAGAALEFAISPYYLSLAGPEADDPIRRQCIPTVHEYSVLPYEDMDPLSDLKYSPVERMVHRYRDRVLILVTDECAVYCRHCFRRHFSSRRQGCLTKAQLEECIQYLQKHLEVHEVILSGGDPLTLEDQKLLEIIEKIRSRINRPLVFRLASRMPVVLPQRITGELISLLKGIPSLFVITQFNHPFEITGESRRAVEKLVGSGIPVMNQAVLLAGVNDSVEVLSGLFQGLLEMRVKPYYLFQGDLAAGTSHFRVPLPAGMELYRELRKRISGLALPVYAVDLPRGGGKVPLVESYLDIEETIDGMGMYRFIGPDGLSYRYPLEQG